jgi:hypothetical protein
VTEELWNIHNVGIFCIDKSRHGHEGHCTVDSEAVLEAR